MPTVLELTDTPAPASLEGKSLVPVLFGQKQKVQDQVFIEIRGTTSIVTDRWKLGINPKDQDGDLYDLKSDPHELDNLFGKTQWAAVQAELIQRIVAFNPDLKDKLRNAVWLKTEE